MIKLDSATKVRILREQRRLSQQELADSAGVSRQTIVRMELSPQWWKKPNAQSLRSLSKVASALGVDLGYILMEEGEEDMPDPKTAAAAAGADPQGAQPGGAAVIDLGTLLAALGRAGAQNQAKDPGPLDVTEPITDRARLPRPAHLEEEWDDQFRCFLEAQRQAYERWTNIPNGTFADLQDLMDGGAEEWADRHGLARDVADDVDPLEGATVIKAGDTLQKDGFLGTVTTVKGSDVAFPVQTIKVRQTRNGQVVDVLMDDDGDTLYLPCRHDTDSTDVDDHLYCSPEEAKERYRDAGKGSTKKGTDRGDPNR